jgi:hypothetical protein
MAAFGGVNTTTPVQVSTGSAIGATASSYAAPSVTTTVANEMLVGSFFAYRNGGAGTTWSAPTGMTELGDATNGTSRSGSLYDSLQAAIGASGTKTAVASSAQTYGMTALTALRPA